MKLLILAVAAITAGGSGVVLSQTSTPPAQSHDPTIRTESGKFGSIDANHDGRISREEAKAQGDLTSAWASLDSDKDTYLSEAEYDKWNTAPSGPTGKTAPSNTERTESNSTGG